MGGILGNLAGEIGKGIGLLGCAESGETNTYIRLPLDASSALFVGPSLSFVWTYSVDKGPIGQRGSGGWQVCQDSPIGSP